MSWTLTEQVSTLVHGLVAPPSTLIDLADEANPLLRDFVHLAKLERLAAWPQVLIVDHFEAADVVPLALFASGITDRLPPVSLVVGADDDGAASRGRSGLHAVPASRRASLVASSSGVAEQESSTTWVD